MGNTSRVCVTNCQSHLQVLGKWEPRRMHRARAGRWEVGAPWHHSKDTPCSYSAAGGWAEIRGSGTCCCSQPQGCARGLLSPSTNSHWCLFCGGHRAAECTPCPCRLNGSCRDKPINRSQGNLIRAIKARCACMCVCVVWDCVLGHSAGEVTPVGRKKRVKEGFIKEVTLI